MPQVTSWIHPTSAVGASPCIRQFQDMTVIPFWSWTQTGISTQRLETCGGLGTSKALAGFTKTSLNQLFKAISKQENAHPEAALQVVGDFNVGKLKSVLPNFYQHVTCNQRGKKTLDHLYSTHRDAYKANLTIFLSS